MKHTEKMRNKIGRERERTKGLPFERDVLCKVGYPSKERRRTHRGVCFQKRNVAVDLDDEL